MVIGVHHGIYASSVKTKQIILQPHSQVKPCLASQSFDCITLLGKNLYSVGYVSL